MTLIALVGWDPVITGYLAVLISILVLCGSVYLILATNLGLRLGFLVAWTGLWGWNLLMGIIWWFFGIGWVGHGPAWEVTHVSTNPEAVPVELVQELSNDVSSTPGGGWQVVVEADAQAKQQATLARAKAGAALEIARALEASPKAEEALRLLLAKEWMAMGEQMATAPGGSVLMVDPQSPAALISALKAFQKSDS